MEQKYSYREKINKNFKAMKSLFKLVNANYWQGIFGPAFAFIFSAIFIGLYGYIMSSLFGSAPEEVAFASFKSSLIGVVALQSMSMAINTVPQSINDFKSSVLMKRIGSTPIKPWSFIVTIASYYAIIMFIVFFWCFLWVTIWFPNDAIPIFSSINWGGLIFAIIYTVITSIFIGLLVVSITKSAVGSAAIGMIIFFLSMFLSGQIFPIQSITNSMFLNVLSYFTPFRYTTGLLTMSWNGADIFNMTQAYELNGQVIYNTYDLWLNWFIPLFFIVISIAISSKAFKWSTR